MTWFRTTACWTEEGVEGVAIDVESSHTSWSCNHKLMLQERSEAVD